MDIKLRLHHWYTEMPALRYVSPTVENTCQMSLYQGVKSKVFGISCWLYNCLTWRVLSYVVIVKSYDRWTIFLGIADINIINRKLDNAQKFHHSCVDTRQGTNRISWIKHQTGTLSLLASCTSPVWRMLILIKFRVHIILLSFYYFTWVPSFSLLNTDSYLIYAG